MEMEGAAKSPSKPTNGLCLRVPRGMAQFIIALVSLVVFCIGFAIGFG